jgi:membrane-bound inhibitor of C-type lysozyme
MKKIFILGTIFILAVGTYVIYSKKTVPTPNTNSVVFTCDNSKTISATFYPDTDTFVNISLSDGRTLSVPHVISGSGARYANSDETFVFWNKGDTAFITEGIKNVTTFSDCVLKK